MAIGGRTMMALAFANLTGIVIGVWIAVWPEPLGPLAAGAAIAPLAALAATGIANGRVTFGTYSKRNIRPTLALLLFGPMVGLAFFDYHRLLLLYWTDAIWLPFAGAALVALAVAFAISRLDPTQLGDQLMFVFCSLGAFAWAAGLALAANELGPHRAHIPAVGMIVAKHHYRHRKSPDTWEIIVRTRKGQFEESFPVSSQEYDTLNEGDPECIVRNEGALKIWWRSVEPCKGSAGWEP